MLLLGAAGCSSAPINFFGESTLLTEGELRQTQASNLMEAVRQARPLWLRERVSTPSGGLPTRIIVYLNDIFQGEADDMLETIPLDWVTRIEYLDAAQADGLPGAGGGRILAAFMIYTREEPEGVDSIDPPNTTKVEIPLR